MGQLQSSPVVQVQSFEPVDEDFQSQLYLPERFLGATVRDPESEQQPAPTPVVFSPADSLQTRALVKFVETYPDPVQQPDIAHRQARIATEIFARCQINLPEDPSAYTALRLLLGPRFAERLYHAVTRDGSLEFRIYAPHVDVLHAGLLLLSISTDAYLYINLMTGRLVMFEFQFSTRHGRQHSRRVIRQHGSIQIRKVGGGFSVEENYHDLSVSNDDVHRPTPEQMAAIPSTVNHSFSDVDALLQYFDNAGFFEPRAFSDIFGFSSEETEYVEISTELGNHPF